MPNPSNLLILKYNQCFVFIHFNPNGLSYVERFRAFKYLAPVCPVSSGYLRFISFVMERGGYVFPSLRFVVTFFSVFLYCLTKNSTVGFRFRFFWYSCKVR